MMNVLPKWERLTYWIIAVTAMVYGLYRLYIEGNEQKKSLYFMEPGWSWLRRDQDTSDLEWIVYRNSLKNLIVANFLHVLISQFCCYLALNVKTRMCILAFFDMAAISYLYGLRSFLVFLAKSIAMYQTPRTGSRLFVWLIALCITAVDILPALAVYQQKLLGLSDQDGSRFNYVIASGFFDLHLISFALDKIIWQGQWKLELTDKVHSNNPPAAKNKEAFTRDSENSEPDLSVFLFYTFHLPKFCNGPFYSFRKFNTEVTSCFRSSSCGINILDVMARLLRCIAWVFFIDLQSHFLYPSTLAFSRNVVERMSLSAVMSAGYWQGQMFMVKYACIYGISGQLLRFDGVTPHANPRCIGWVYSYNDMWKHFDVGLYQFVKNYIYIPLGGSHSGLARQILSSAMSFLFIYIWHGAQLNLLYWCLGSFVTATLETLGHCIEHSAYGIEVKYRLSPAFQTRLCALLTVPVYIMSCWSVFFFLFGIEVTGVIIRKMVQGTLVNVILELIVLTSAVHNAMYISQRTQSSRDCLGH